MLQCALALSVISSNAAFAETAVSYPKGNVPVRIVTPYAPGGGTDTLARTLAPQLASALKTSVVVENKPGAGGLIGADHVAKSAPDGHTILITITSLIQAPSIYTTVPFDPIKDFVPIALMARVPLVFAVRSDLPAKDVKEFVHLAKADPQKYPLGNYGTGTLSHIMASMLTSQAGLDATHVSYKGIPPLIQDLLGGQIAGGFVDLTTLPHVKSGRLKYLGVTGPSPLAQMPELQTLNGQGFKDFEVFGWAGAFVPAGTPKPIVEVLAREFTRLMSEPEYQSRLNTLSYQPGGMDRQEFGRMLGTDLQMWARLIKQANIPKN
ncbi:tripartite tricarboxylate transporter substrate binding protein [Quisquiliibacterium transsilvanicum]